MVAVSVAAAADVSPLWVEEAVRKKKNVVSERVVGKKWTKCSASVPSIAEGYTTDLFSETPPVKVWCAKGFQMIVCD